MTLVASDKIKSIWAFNPAQQDEEFILNTLVGKDKLVSDLINWLRANKGMVPEKHRLFYGPRGIGKTTLLLAVYYNILKNNDLIKSFLPIIFPEDTSRLNSEQNFVKAVHDSLSQNVKNLGIEDKFKTHAWRPFLDSLLDFSHSLKRPFIFFIDSLQSFIKAVLESRGRRKGNSRGLDFLSHLLSSPEIIVIACSLKKSQSRKGKEESVWNRFETAPLYGLQNVSEANALIEKLAIAEGKESLIQEILKYSGRIRGIFYLSNGNPRYIVMLYRILRKEKFDSLQVDFNSILDGLTGILDAEMERQISPSQLPVLISLAKCGGRGTKKDVLDQYVLPGLEKEAELEKEVGNVLSSLTYTDFVEVDPNAKGRMKIYQITPPLFQLWLELRHLGISHRVILLEIFEYYPFSKEEVSSSYASLMEEIRKRPDLASHMVGDLLFYSHLTESKTEHVSDLMELGRSAVRSGGYDEFARQVKDCAVLYKRKGKRYQRLQDELLSVYLQYLNKETEQAEKELDQLIEELSSGEPVPILLAYALYIKADIQSDEYHYQESLDLCSKALENLQTLETEKYEQLKGDIYQVQGKSYAMVYNFENAMESFNKALELHRRVKDRKGESGDLRYIGVIFLQRGELVNSMKYQKEALRIDKEIEDKQGEAKDLGNIGVIYRDQGKLDEALKILGESLTISQEITDEQVEANQFYNIGVIYLYQGKLDEALKNIEHALRISKNTQNERGEAASLGNIGLIYRYQGKLDEALKNHKESLRIHHKINYKSGEAVCLSNIGLIYRDQGRLDKALKKFERALRISREIREKQGEAKDLGNIGVIYWHQGKLDDALKIFDESLRISQEIEYKEGEAVSLGNIGMIYGGKGKFDVALKNFKESLRISQEIGYKQEEANQLNNIGLIYLNQGKLDESLMNFEKALSISKEIGYKRVEAASLSNIGLMYRVKGKLDESLMNFEKALSIFKEIGNKRLEAPNLSYIGKIYQEQGRLDVALKNFEEALRISREIKDKPGEANQLGYIVNIYRSQGKMDEELKNLRELLQISGEIGDKLEESKQLVRIGLIYRDQGKLDMALKNLEESLRIHRELGDKLGEANQLGNVGLIYMDQGKFDVALKHYEEAHRIHREIRDKIGEATGLSNIGLIYGVEGKLDEALKNYEDAIRIHREIGDKKGEALNLSNIGKIYQYQGRLDVALKYFEEALIIFQEIEDKQEEASNLSNIGKIYRDRRRLEEALKNFKEAFRIYQDIGNKQGEANQLSNIGVICFDKHELDEALKNYEDALRIHREIGDKKGEALNLSNIGGIYRAHGKLDEALKNMEEALKISREIGYKKGEAGFLLNIGLIYKNKSKLDEALKFLNDALKIADEYGFFGLQNLLRNMIFDTHVQHSRELALSNKPNQAAIEVEKAGDFLDSFENKDEIILKLHSMLFISLLQKGFLRESEMLKESVERWKVEELKDYLSILGAAIKHLLDPEKSPVPTLPPVERTTAYEIIRQARGQKTLQNAIDLMYQGKYDESLEICEQLLKETPDDLKAVRIARDSAIISNQLSKAEDYVKKAVILSNRFPDDVGHWGWYLLEKGDIDSAKEALSEAINNGSNILGHYSKLATIYDKQKKFKEAEDTIRKALENLPLNDEQIFSVNVNIMEYLIMQDKIKEAAEILELIDPDKLSFPHKTEYLFHKFLSKCLQKDRASSSSALEQYCTILQSVKEKNKLYYDFTNLLEYASGHLSKTDSDILRRWASVANGISTPGEFIENKKSMEEFIDEFIKIFHKGESSLAIRRIQLGDVQSLNDIIVISHDPWELEASFDGYADEYEKLEKDHKEICRRIVKEALSPQFPFPVKSLSRAAGLMFWDFNQEERSQVLDGMLKIAENKDNPLEIRDVFLRVLGAMYFQLEPEEKTLVISRIQNIKKDYAPDHLRELLSKISPVKGENET